MLVIMIMIKDQYRFYPRSFKKRYYNNISNFVHKIYRHRTSLSNHELEIKKKTYILY